MCSAIINMVNTQSDFHIHNNAATSYLGILHSLMPLFKIISTHQKSLNPFSLHHFDYTKKIRLFNLNISLPRHPSSPHQDFSILIHYSLLYSRINFLLPKDERLHSFFINLFIYFWLCWVFVSVRGLCLVAASGGHSSSRCAGLSLLRPLLLRNTGRRR